MPPATALTDALRHSATNLTLPSFTAVLHQARICEQNSYTMTCISVTDQRAGPTVAWHRAKYTIQSISAGTNTNISDFLAFTFREISTHLSWLYSVFKQVLRWSQVRSYARYAALPVPFHQSKTPSYGKRVDVVAPGGKFQGATKRIFYTEKFHFLGRKNFKLWSQIKINSINTVEPVYNDIGLYDTSSITSDIL